MCVCALADSSGNAAITKTRVIVVEDMGVLDCSQLTKPGPDVEPPVIVLEGKPASKYNKVGSDSDSLVPQ